VPTREERVRPCSRGYTFEVRVWGLKFGGWVLGFGVQGAGFGVKGLGFEVRGLEFGV